MHVENANPTPTARGEGAMPAWARRLWASLGQGIRYQQALHRLRQLDDRDLDDLGIARADFPALADRHARGLAPLAGPWRRTLL